MYTLFWSKTRLGKLQCSERKVKKTIIIEHGGFTDGQTSIHTLININNGQSKTLKAMCGYDRQVKKLNMIAGLMNT